MHRTAMMNGKSFFDCYGKHFSSEEKVRVVEIGSQDVNGSLKDVCPPRFEYVGVDFAVARNVDVVLTDPYSLPFENESVDIVVTSSCLEHSEMFWLVILEIFRILKPHGLFYANTPSRGTYHRYPVDCWRFYPDSGMALSKWARRNGFNTSLLESYTQTAGHWGDSVAIFLKDAALSERYPDRVIDTKKDFVNARQEGGGEKIARWSETNRSGSGTVSLIKRLIPKSLRPAAEKLYDRFS